jgi:two-component system sensor histidine kinase GlrK
MPLTVQIRYPKSFFKLLSAGFLLAVLPLLVGLLANTVAIQRLAGMSQQAVFDAARIAHASRELTESVTALERAARQSVVLRDPALWDGYLGQHARFLAAGEQMAGLPLEAAMRKGLEELMRQEGALHQELSGMNRVASLDERYAGVFLAAQELLAQSNAAIDREAEALRRLGAETESNVRTQLIVLLPVALFIVAGFTYLLARPIAQLDHGIRNLGEGRFDAPIDVTGPEDLEQLGRQLDWLRLRLAQLEEQKSRFLRHVSHELKTPLTALREGSELLAEEVAGPLTPGQRDIARILRENSQHLQRLIEDLLRHGEAEFRDAPLKLQPVKLAEVIAAVAEKQKLAIAARHLRLALRAEDFVLRTDAERLRVVLDNLISNAVKFSPDGGTLTVSVKRGVREAVIEVEDEGPGVAAEDRERIFDPFYRGSRQAQGMVKGTGLGLSITKEHVLALGGRIEVGANSGRFTVTLPAGDGKEKNEP